MKRLRIPFLVLFICSTLKAQVGGEEVFQFLNLPTSARQLALGGEVLTLIDNVNQANWNPALINTELDKNLGISYMSFLAGINLGSISYAQVINRSFGTLYGNITYLNYGTLIGADENGIETGNFNASDVSLSVGYSYNIPNSNFYIGSNIRFINSSIESFSSTGITTDLAVLYSSNFRPYTITVVVRNLGTQLTTYNGTSEKIPLRIAAGFDYQLENVPLKWYVTMNNLQQWNLAVPNPSNQTSDLEGNITDESISFFDNALRHFVVGAELFPKSAVNLRLGYNFRRASELKLQNARTFSGISFGFGVRFNKVKLNYAFSKYHSASNASTFSILIDFDKR